MRWVGQKTIICFEKKFPKACPAVSLEKTMEIELTFGCILVL